MSTSNCLPFPIRLPAPRFSHVLSASFPVNSLPLGVADDAIACCSFLPTAWNKWPVHNTTQLMEVCCYKKQSKINIKSIALTKQFSRAFAWWVYKFLCQLVWQRCVFILSRPTKQFPCFPYSQVVYRTTFHTQEIPMRPIEIPDINSSLMYIQSFKQFHIVIQYKFRDRQRTLVMLLSHTGPSGQRVTVRPACDTTSVIIMTVERQLRISSCCAPFLLAQFGTLSLATLGLW